MEGFIFSNPEPEVIQAGIGPTKCTFEKTVTTKNPEGILLEDTNRKV